MKSYKELIDSLGRNADVRRLTDEEMKKIRKIYLQTFDEIVDVCNKYDLTVMLIGGSVIGAVRHQGFIPWDDDLDIAMPRSDFEKFKRVFVKEMGKKYTLSSPNYKNNARNRFPQVLVNGTKCVSVGSDPNSKYNQIKVDIFIIENVPENPVHRAIKGTICSGLMYVASCADSYQNDSELSKAYMCQTKEGKKVYKKRMIMGRIVSFWSAQKWFDIVDSACQYKKESKLMSIPTGRKHYFGEVRPVSTFLPPSNGQFEGRTVKLPGDYDDYCKNLYGDYMTIPPENKREVHWIYDIQFHE